MSLTIPQKLIVAEICEGLISVAILKGGVFADGIDVQLPNKIRNIRESIQYQYNLNPSDITLIKTSNHLMGMCLFSDVAERILLNPGTTGGTVAGSVPSPLRFTVLISGSPMINGQTSLVIPSFINYNLIFIRNGVAETTVDAGGGTSFFTWLKVSGSFTCYPAANTSEAFQLIPV